MENEGWNKANKVEEEKERVAAAFEVSHLWSKLNRRVNIRRRQRSVATSTQISSTRSCVVALDEATTYTHTRNTPSSLFLFPLAKRS